MVSSYTNNDIEDINKLGSILNDNFDKLFHIENLNNNEKIYVYKEDNKLVGFIHISINYEVADLLNIVVSKDYRNKGIATILMDYMITDLPKDVTRILLEVNEKNISAIKLYNKFSFEIINKRKNYYGQNNALIMERILKWKM